MGDKRIQFDLPAETVAEWEKWMEISGLNNRRELLNNALTLFEWALKQRMEGRTIASVDEEKGFYRELSMPALDKAAKNAR